MRAINAIIAAINDMMPIGTNVAQPDTDSDGADSYVEDTPPKVTWVPTTAVMGPPLGQGGSTRRTAQGDTLPDGSQPPIASIWQTVEARIWGGDRDLTEQLWHDVIRAVHAACGPVGYKDAGARWLETESALKHGEEVRHAFVFGIPVERAAPTTATITSMPITPVVTAVI